MVLTRSKGILSVVTIMVSLSDHRIYFVSLNERLVVVVVCVPAYVCTVFACGRYVMLC